MPADREVLRARLQALGFDVVRFARADSPAPGSDALAAWLAAGHQADMAWIERGAPKRRDPGLILSGAKSFILLGVNYGSAPAGAATPPLEDGGTATARWARYALHDDYHDTIRTGLEAAGRELETWGRLTPQDHRYYVDTGPVLERGWATRAGLGFTGKNAMLISREFGNWLFLAAIVTRAAIAPDAPVSPAVATRPVGTWCGQCTRCLEACPTQALVAPGVLDARRCISYQTIENRGMIPLELRRGIGTRIYGCDICAEVCPWNRFAHASRSVLLRPRPELAGLTLRELLTLTPERFAVVFKGTAIKRVKLRGLVRNACIVAANAGAVALLPELVALAAEHGEALVRAHAVWAVGELGGAGRLAQARERETDPLVRAEYARFADPGDTPA